MATPRGGAATAVGSRFRAPSAQSGRLSRAAIRNSSPREVASRLHHHRSMPASIARAARRTNHRAAWGLLFVAPTLGCLSVACGAANDDTAASAGNSALVSAPPASGCANGKEGQICGTDANLNCDVGLVCDAPESLLVARPAGVCRAPNTTPALNPSKPACGPSKAGGVCGSEAGIVCGPGLSCMLPETGTGLVVPSGTCRIAKGQPCVPEPLGNSGCAPFLICDFDRDSDPMGASAKCVSPEAIDAHFRGLDGRRSGI
jgi:hypothetical protein